MRYIVWREPMMKKAIVVITLVVSIAMAGGYIGYFTSPQAPGMDEASARPQSIEEIQTKEGTPVRVAPVAQQDIKITQTFYGTVCPYAEANVQGKHGGKILTLNAEEGEPVTAGEVIVQFDAEDVQLQLQQAIAAKNTAIQNVNQAASNFETTQKTVQRYQELFDDGFIARQTLDDVQNSLQATLAELNSAREQVKNADAQINLLRNTLQDLSIEAPISGIVDEKHYHTQEIARPGAIIYHVVDIEKVYIEVEIPESYISQIQQQMTVEVSFDSLASRQISGVIDRILPTGNAQNRTFIAKVLVDNPDHVMKPGMFAQIHVCLEEIPQALVFNKKALLKDGADYYVFKVVEQQAQKVPVAIVHRAGNSVAVLSEDLSPQDQVVVEGGHFLTPNEQVNIL
ncbi:efflux RND transporter periplasmic adaptor subunit [candidate division KSB3 bacterium]|uniref:Efflux RND transporter periplasmic adaptor subunit n=1 Tax=candidate division KSB3 bacterium TaxID=2044937 RepID=A0A9D5JVV1_9BACT|nr:efflux RND transporter periplasmic adaptor subunit [candidate division KSB3 bacterium]MBD3325070.1 efflux RND transporter periplasmic adaptor subunit [candidate division KSB3 bacterium]